MWSCALKPTGLVSEPLSQYVKSIVGVDISQVSVDRYNARAAQLGFAPEKMKAVCVELKGESGELDGAKFDVVVVRTFLLYISSSLRPSTVRSLPSFSLVSSSPPFSSPNIEH